MSLLTERTGLSPNFLNPKIVYTGTGDQILALAAANTPKVLLANANSTNGVLIQDKVYFRKVDNTLQVLNLTKHYHDTDLDETGGLLQESYYRNLHQTLNIDLWGAMLLPGMQNCVGTGAAITADFDNVSPAGGKIKLDTGPYSNNVANIRHGGRGHNWGLKSKFETVLQVSGASNIVVRAGVNAEPLTLTNDTGKKVGIEFCDSSGPNWQIFSSNGVRNILNTSYAGGAAATNYKIDHTPATNTRLQVGPSSYTIKSDNCPGSGTSDSARLLSAGVKTVDTTTKSMYIWGFAFCATPSDGWY